ncbi:RNA-directed DNA polymerase [Theileria orientalis]|uniref:Telomerase reverse transcriptase n=1 Tax=Theileria orientalis TaxID=68886 RepID=A0A976M5D7_THEOR|nr:RNA-directed DNA polymerase [Theileria orientalis]
MKDYSLRRLRSYIFSLYDIQKDCVKTSEYIENLSKIRASTLYDLVKYYIALDRDHLATNFVCLVLKCIIVHLENVAYSSKDGVYQGLDKFQNVKIASVKYKKVEKNGNFIINSCFGASPVKYSNIHLNFNEPNSFFNSELGNYIKKCCGSVKIAKLLQNHRVLIPSRVFELSRSPLIRYIAHLNEFDPKYKSLIKIFKSVLNNTSRNRYADDLKCRKTLFVHCSGSILSNKAIKSCEKDQSEKKFISNWSKMVIYRNFIFLKSKTKNRRVVYKTIFDSVPSDDATVMKLLSYILFNDDAFSQELKRRRISINELMLSLHNKLHTELVSHTITVDNKGNESIDFPVPYGYNDQDWEFKRQFVPQKPRKNRRKSVLHGLFVQFKKFISSLKSIDWYDTKCLVSEELQGANFSAVNVASVYKYVKNIVEKTMSPELLCGRSNYLKFLRLCYSIITLNRGENPSMAELMKGIKIKDCGWTKGSYHSRGQTRTILEYLCRLIFFLLQYFIIPVIGRHLHITECGFSKYRVYYIKKDEWMRMIRAAKREFLFNGKICDQLPVVGDFPKIRFVPKHTGMRPILNCNTQAGCKAFYQTLLMKYSHRYKPECQCYICYVYYELSNKKHLNSVLRKIHRALTANSRIRPIMGNGVLGYNSFYRHLKSWWIRFVGSLRSVDNPKLYYFIADLSRCYERIPHDKLMDALNALPLSDSTMCMMHKRYIVKLASGVNSFSKLEDVSSLSLPKMSHLSSRLYGNFIITSNFSSTRGSRVTKFDIVSAVSALISSLKLQLPNSHTNKYMKLNRGIPQGCCISPFLSNLYLSCLDKNLLSNAQSSFVEKGASITLPNLLVRWIDDFLFVSTSREDVNNMSEILRSNNIGAVMNLNKVFTNADCYDPNDNCDRSSNAIEWINCKFNFDIKNRYIDVEIVPWRSPELKIRDSICLSRGRYGSFMFTFIEQRLLGSITNKLEHKTYTCSLINSPKCIMSNAYTVMRLCSLKLRCAIQVLTEQFGGFINLKYIFRLIINLVTIASNLVANGGINTRENHLREVLLISFINTFKHRSLRQVRSNRKSKYLRLIHRQIVNLLYRQIEPCVNRDAIFRLASDIERKYKSTWSNIL